MDFVVRRSEIEQVVRDLLSGERKPVVIPEKGWNIFLKYGQPLTTNLIAGEVQAQGIMLGNESIKQYLRVIQFDLIKEGVLENTGFKGCWKLTPKVK